MNGVLYDSLYRYYDNKNNMNKFYDNIQGNQKISLRIIDWFVTNYSKKNNVFYEIYETSNGDLTFDSDENRLHKQINIYHSYKSQLKSYSKKKFDPFCRRDRLNFECKGCKVETTLGQLNFFKWALENLITDYILLHYKEIEEDMNICYNNNKKLKKSHERKPRQELSKSASRGLNSSSHKIKLDFN
tara:strand:- start:827 stop:1387 length:561 start_codon:yes stop_codon:yes gene_type:complete